MGQYRIDCFNVCGLFGPDEVRDFIALSICHAKYRQKEICKTMVLARWYFWRGSWAGYDFSLRFEG